MLAVSTRGGLELVNSRRPIECKITNKYFANHGATNLFSFSFFFAERSKYYKKELAYIPCYDDEWLVDELRERTRPDKRNNLTLSDVLRRSEAFERGDGLLPVRTTFMCRLRRLIKRKDKLVVTNL